MKCRNSLYTILILVPVAVFLLGCPAPIRFDVVASDLQRDRSPEVDDNDYADLVDGNTSFAFDLYHALKAEPGNMFFSPFSISQATAMVYAGARGDTEMQIADVFHFDLDGENLHPAFNQLDLDLAGRAGDRNDEGFTLHIANSIWGQGGYEWMPDFLDTIKVNYDAGLNIVDFVADPEGSRDIINDWVEGETRNLITNLFPSGSITSATRMALVNAIYFEAEWLHKFDPDDTRDDMFFMIDGAEIDVPMMYQEEEFNYSEGDGWQAVEMPYEGFEVAMVILLPEIDRFEEIEDQLDTGFFGQILDDLDFYEVHLTMPKFETESSFLLADILADMGMPDAFEYGPADFSGMDGSTELFISTVVHKAYCMVDEERTVAAAATGHGMDLQAMPAADDFKVFRADHPFFYIIKDRETGTILFVGRIMDPRN